MNDEYPHVITQDSETREPSFYTLEVRRILSHILPPDCFQGEGALEQFHKKLPLLSWTPLKASPCHLTFFICARSRPNAFRFFYDLLSRWLIPGKSINVLLHFAVDFRMPTFSDEMYVAGEMMIPIASEQEAELVQKQLPIIETEVRLGMDSSYHAYRILERKGVTSDEKTVLIQENIASLVKHRPQDFDYDIFSEMQSFLVLCKEEFKASRSYKHMSRIICVHYLFRKALRLTLEAFPDRRYISVKLIRLSTKMHQKVLGIVLGLSFLKENEVFESRHILNGVSTLIPKVKIVEGSFFTSTGRSEPTCALYIEIVKEDGGAFSLEEAKLLKEELPSTLKKHIEHRLNPVFMPLNEEEVMRHIVTLSCQLKRVTDLPQVVISFTQQTQEALEFVVIVLRVLRTHMPSLGEVFERKPTYLEYLPDRREIVGTLRKSKKEATVFRVRLRKTPFLRQDHSVDLNKARQDVVVELTRLIGEFRDFNGGTLSKETELFASLRRLLGAKGMEHTFLLENFFYSLSPAVVRSVLPPEPLCHLFEMLLQAEAAGLNEANYLCQMTQNDDFFFALIMASEGSFRDSVLDHLKGLEPELITCFVHTEEYPCLGILLRVDEKIPIRSVRYTIEQALAEWQQTKELMYI